VQRDLRDLARISMLDALSRLLTLAAGQTARLLNVSELSGPFSVSRVTIRDYVTLLQRVFLLEELPPWHSNRLSRLVKTPKLHVGDTGLVCALLGIDAATLKADKALLGQLLETFVFQEVRRQASWYEDRCPSFTSAIGTASRLISSSSQGPVRSPLRGAHSVPVGGAGLRPRLCAF
jgi:predicted AAA+ superfamily ATPase